MSGALPLPGWAPSVSLDSAQPSAAAWLFYEGGSGGKAPLARIALVCVDGVDVVELRACESIDGVARTLRMPLRELTTRAGLSGLFDALSVDEVEAAIAEAKARA